MNQTRLNNNQADERAEYRLTKEERETIYRIDEVDNIWYADSTVQKDIHKLEKQGWIETGVQYYKDGTVMGKQFKAPRNCLSPRTYNPHKPKKNRPPLSEEQKMKMQNARKNINKGRNI